MKKLSNYQEFVLENVQAAKALLKKIGKSSDDTAYKQIIQWLGNALGYAHWFVKQHYVNSATLEELKQIIDTLKTEKAIIDKFTTPVIKLENCEKFWDEFLTQSRNAEAKAAYNEFPYKQKRFLDLSNPEHVQMLKDLWTDPDKRTFLIKLASYTDKQTLLQKLHNHLYLKTSKVAEELLQSLKDDLVNIVYEDCERGIIITTVNYEQIVKFCSDTAWCIVRSESTFNHYMKGDYLTKQFVIFLPCRTDLLRKVGVTNGATRMTTAHQLDDRYLSKEKVFELLKEYGVNSKTIFLDEIKKQFIEDFDFNDYPVEVLINLGFNKEAIVKDKTIFRKTYIINPTKTDLSFFTEEEIEKWNLLDKTELSVQDLINLSSQTIIKKKLWLRTPNFKFVNFFLLDPIHYDIAIEIAKEHFKNDKEAKTFIRSERKNIFNKIKNGESNSYFYLPLIRTKEEFSKDLEMKYSEFSRVARNLLELKSKWILNKEASFFKYSGFLVIASQYYKIDKEKLIKSIHSIDYTINNILILQANPDIIPKNDLNNNQKEIIEILKEILKEKLLNKNDETILTTQLMGEIKSIISDEDIYRQIFQMKKKQILENPWDFSRFVYEEQKIPNLNVLNFWQFDSTVSLDKWRNIFKRSESVENLQLIHQYLDGLGLDISSKEYFDFICSLINKNNTSLWSFCLKNGIGGTEAIDVLLESTLKGEVDISNDEMKEYKSFLSDETYKKLVEALLFNFARKQTVQGKIFDPEWLSNRFPVLKRNKDKVEEYNLLENLIVSLAKLEQEKELMDLDIPIKNIRIIESLATKIEGTDKWEAVLPLSQRKLIWDYIKRNNQVENKADSDRVLLSCRFLFDKKNLDKWLEKAKLVKNNEEYYGRAYKDGTKRRTNRVYAISELLNYLALKQKPEDIRLVLSKFHFNKWEKNWAKSYWYEREYNFMKISDSARQAISSIWEEKKLESIITSFENFEYL